MKPEKDSSKCIFCKMLRGEIPVEPVHETDHLIVLKDIDAQAPVHVLLVPREHIATLNELQQEHADLITHWLLTASEVARKLGVGEKGYRLVLNCGDNGGQTVYHVHMHLLGGRFMEWPPG